MGADVTPGSLLKARADQEQKNRTLLILVCSLVGTFVVVMLLLGVIFGVGRVNGNSMHPVMGDGDIFVYWRLDKDYAVGDVVVYRHDEGDLRVKRIVGLENDVLDIEDGRLTINGEEEAAEIFYETELVENGIEFPCVAPVGHVLLMGDKRDTSEDSRVYGAVNRSRIQGKVIMVMRSGF